MTPYTDRYAHNWDTIRKRALESIAHRCPCCLGKAKEVHHLRYRDLLGAIAGREKPGVDIIPLCLECHDKAHLDRHWITAKVDPKLNNRNTWNYTFKLRLDYWLLRSVVILWRLAVPVRKRQRAKIFW